MISDLAQNLTAIDRLDFTSDGWVPVLETHLADIVQLGDPDCLVPLMKTFDDKAIYDEGMFSIIHTVETFSDDIYATALLTALPAMIHKAPRWASIVVMRVLNSPETLGVLHANLAHATPHEKEALGWLLGEINKVSDDFDAKTRNTLDLLQAA